jgi:hypothetical protein
MMWLSAAGAAGAAGTQPGAKAAGHLLVTALFKYVAGN